MIQRLALAALLVLTIAATAAAGVHFLPDATRDQVAPAGPTRSLATWQLPEGLLVVDRGPDGAPTLDGTELTPRYADGAWYLVDRDRRTPADPADFGHVHLAGASAWVVEVPRARHAAFLAAAFRLQYLDRSPLAAAPAPAESRTEDLALPVVDPAVKAAYVDELAQASYDQLLREITGDTTFWLNGGPFLVSTRYYNTGDNDVVAEYLAQKLASYGYTVELDDFTAWGDPCHNVVATRTGTTSPEEIVVVGGHFDSTSEQPGTLAPGAEDNGSGTALVMELARISAERDFERTVQFVLFDAEEIGLRGSQHFVDEAMNEGRQIVAAITADMVSYYDRSYGVIIEGEQDWEWLMTTMADNVTALTDIDFEKTYYSWGSDHVPFQQAGIPAFLAIDQDWDEYPYYHGSDDSWQNVAASVPIALQIARAAAGTLADVAGLVGGTTAVPVPAAAPVALAAHPNPFNPLTTLSFRLDRPARGELAIFDLGGRRLATVAAGVFLAGEHSLRWTGEDASGRALPSGIYVARLRTDAGTASHKLNLVR